MINLYKFFSFFFELSQVYLTRIERRKSASVGYNPNARIIVVSSEESFSLIILNFVFPLISAYHVGKTCE